MEKQKKKPDLKFIKLKAMRRKYHIEQADFEILLGIKKQTYSNKENGRLLFSFQDIMKILWAFNRKAERAGHEPVAFEDVFLRPEDNIPVKSREPVKPTLDECLLVYRMWFGGLSTEKQLKEMGFILGYWHPEGKS